MAILGHQARPPLFFFFLPAGATFSYLSRTSHFTFFFHFFSNPKHTHLHNQSMRFSTLHGDGLQVMLEPGESIKAESDALVAMPASFTVSNPFSWFSLFHIHTLALTASSCLPMPPPHLRSLAEWMAAYGARSCGPSLVARACSSRLVCHFLPHHSSSPHYNFLNQRRLQLTKRQRKITPSAS